MALRFLTAGESHGPALQVIVEGLPAGIRIDPDRVDGELKRRMGGFGRGGRMEIERDRVEWLAGVRFGKTLGSPVAMQISNLDHANWSDAMSPLGPVPEGDKARRVTRPRPGHADLAGSLKYDTHDARDVFERSSARETAARTAAGALAKLLLETVGIKVTSHTVAVGEVQAPALADAAFDALAALTDEAPMRVLDDATMQAMIDAVKKAQADGESIGGQFEVLARGVPPGLGSHVHWDRRLDGRLAGALMSIQAVKAVSVGEGVEGATRPGSEHHDTILHSAERGFERPTNRAGGIEGGMSNGETIRCRGWLKPLATLPRPLESADLVTKQPFEAVRERTDTIPIVAAGVVGEAMVAWILAEELLIKFGGDCVRELRRTVDAYRRQLAEY
ncbi:MAG: chorismate synthase [Acidobacteria bacterium]|nr:chorismate synthase [Acidobacteriota bacterium]NIM64088.1 chorismate synthase [Acidobacteriota bacterium]NIO58231.1 chorismate synthase [Acidobacteriota bacterium]NIQ86453.1 chorismate synthase [Acidobacteriota bacterium]NIT09998.1 chorismate synthase [Acidobacteriota bacterium]